ncbi:hypothetical protein LEMLEM_LOCUS24919 [Lemmus lemmus]
MTHRLRIILEVCLPSLSFPVLRMGPRDASQALGAAVIQNVLIKITKTRAGEMAQRLRALTALPEVLSSIPSNHMVAHSYL